MSWQDDPVVASASASTSSGGGGGWQNDPIVGGGSPTQSQHGALYNTLFKEGTGGGNMMQSADEGILPAARDYALAGADDLTLGALGGWLPKSAGDLIKQAHSNLGPMDYVEGAAAYGAGPGKVLAPAAKYLAGSGLAGTVAEGMLAGGAATAAGGDLSPSDIAAGAGKGAALGGAANLLTRGANAGLTKALGSPGVVDPAAAEAQTFANQQAKYGNLHASTAPAFDAKTVSQPYVDSINSLTDVQKDDAKGLMNKMQTHVDMMQQKKQLSTGDVDEFARSIQDAASPTNNAEQILASRVRDALTGENGVLATAPTVNGQPVGQAYTMLGDAKDAYQQWKMAQNLSEWQRKAAVGASLGERPMTEAETYYQGKPQYQTLADLYKQSQGQQDPSWALSHMAAGALGDLAGASGLGFLGHLGGEALGYLVAKPAIKGMVKGSKQTALGRNIQKAYPGLIGVQPTGAVQAPQAGNLIKNLMLGGAY